MVDNVGYGGISKVFVTDVVGLIDESTKDYDQVDKKSNQ